MTRNRFRYLVIAVVIAVVFVTVASLVQLCRMNGESSAAADEAMGGYQCSKISSALYKLRLSEYRTAAQDSGADIAEAQKDISVNSDEIKAALRELDKIAPNLSAEKISAYTEAYNNLNSYMSSAAKLAEEDIAAEGADPNRAAELINDGRDSFEASRRSTEALADMFYSDIPKARDSINGMFTMAVIIATIAIIFILALAFILVKSVPQDAEGKAGYFDSSRFDIPENSVSACAAELTTAIGNMAGGNFNFELSQTYEGGLSGIKDSFLELRDYLNDTIFRIGKSANLVTEGAEHMSVAAHVLSQGAIDQAATIVDLFTDVHEISEQISDTDSDVKKALESADLILSSIKTGSDSLSTAVEEVAGIEKAASELFKIIDSMDEIAAHSNKLALNVAMEVSKTKSDSGFANVADNVRSLATKNADIAGRTSEILKESASSVKISTEKIRQAAEAVASVVDHASEIHEIIDHISKHTKSERKAIAEISEGINNISMITQNNAATSEEAAASCQELAAESSILHELTDDFIYIGRDARSKGDGAEAGKISSDSDRTNRFLPSDTDDEYSPDDSDNKYK